MFRNSSNLVITGGHFTDIGNNHDAVSTTLLQHVASGAIFDSAERYPPGKCHPRTRQKIIERIINWIKDANPAQRILWLYGPAGAGKSSLMQSLCELLRDSYPGLNGGSFFFARGNTIRGNDTKLFVTLSYQLAIQFPSVRAEINHALSRDPTLPTKSRDIQLRSLIIDPLLHCTDFSSIAPTLFIDGLDECEGNEGIHTQHQIIALIAKSIIEHDIPIRFIISSRPEYWIRDAFEISPLPDITYFLSLQDDVDADQGIRAYLRDEFEKIYQENRRTMEFIESPWLSESIIDRLVEEASGQYIYASTIVKFIGNHPFNNPVEQLRIITTPGPHRASAYSELDRLYATVISVYPKREIMKRVLGGLLIGINLTGIRVFLGVPRMEITLVLDTLSSLIDVFPPTPLSVDDQPLIPIFGSSFEDEKISFCHLSFREFLLDDARSGLCHVNIEAIHSEVISTFFGIIQHNIDKNYEFEPHILCNMSLLEYRGMMEATLHSFPFGSSYNFLGLSAVLNSMMGRFRHFDPGRRMNHPGCFMRDMDLLSGLLRQMAHTILNIKTENSPDSVEQAALIDSFLAMANRLRNLAQMAGKSVFTYYHCLMASV